MTRTTHFIASGASGIDSADLEDAYRNVTEYGYGQKDTGSTLLVLANDDEAEVIQGLRAGKESRTGGPVGKFDYVPAKMRHRT